MSTGLSGVAAVSGLDEGVVSIDTPAPAIATASADPASAALPGDDSRAIAHNVGVAAMATTPVVRVALDAEELASHAPHFRRVHNIRYSLKVINFDTDLRRQFYQFGPLAQFQFLVRDEQELVSLWLMCLGFPKVVNELVLDLRERLISPREVHSSQTTETISNDLK